MLDGIKAPAIGAWLENLTSTPHLAGTEEGEMVGSHPSPGTLSLSAEPLNTEQWCGWRASV